MIKKEVPENVVSRVTKELREPNEQLTKEEYERIQDTDNSNI